MANPKPALMSKAELQKLLEPKNRREVALGILDQRILWEGGAVDLDPNGMAMLCVIGDYPLGLPFTDQPSILSGAPAYLYQSDDMELALSFEELDRFLRHDLKPDEFFKVLAFAGMHFEIHDDFYDLNSGEAVQPRSRGRQFKASRARIHALTERAEIERAAQDPAPQARRATL